jgi:hypothetical protein
VALSGASRRWFVLDEGNDSEAVDGQLAHDRTVGQRILQLKRNVTVEPAGEWQTMFSGVISVVGHHRTSGARAYPLRDGLAPDG